MNPADYDAWYRTPRGRWIGETEYALAARMLAARRGETLLDVGCGTGWFSRRAAADGLAVTGLDPNPVWLDYARAHSGPDLRWVEGDARALPFADASFDHVLSIAALCFVDDARRAVAEIVRVARRGFAVGWLNRTSLLYLDKGRGGGSGAYRGARWHAAREVRALFSGLPVQPQAAVRDLCSFGDTRGALARAGGTRRAAMGRDADAARREGLSRRRRSGLSRKES